MSSLWNVLLSVLLSGCTAASTPPSPVPTPSPSGMVTLETFGAFSCSICNEELPKLEDYLHEKLGPEMSKFKVITFVVDANNQAKADEYGDRLDLDFEMKPDYRCRGEYAKYWPGRCSVPSTVLLNSNGDVIRNFGVGSPNFDSVVREIRKAVE